MKVTNKYKISVDVKLQTEKEAAAYPCEHTINFCFSEICQVGKDPVPYLRQRIAEEVKRHADAASIDWMPPADEGKDPLTGDAIGF
jgi:hypothetical protein